MSHLLAPPTVISLQGPPRQTSLHRIAPREKGRQLDRRVDMVQLHLREYSWCLDSRGLSKGVTPRKMQKLEKCLTKQRKNELSLSFWVYYSLFLSASFDVISLLHQKYRMPMGRSSNIIAFWRRRQSLIQPDTVWTIPRHGIVYGIGLAGLSNLVTVVFQQIITSPIRKRSRS